MFPRDTALGIALRIWSVRRPPILPTSYLVVHGHLCQLSWYISIPMFVSSTAHAKDASCPAIT
jgi:hypothetical protein